MNRHSPQLIIGHLGFGGAALGNLYAPVSEECARAALAAAYESGIRYFDTAPFYGFGLSERRIGDALRCRTDVIVSSKVGRLLDPVPWVRDDSERHGFFSAMPFEPRFDYSYDGVMRSWEASLQRLGLARIDILYIHDIGAATHGDKAAHYANQLLGGGLTALQKLRADKSISAFGLGVNEIPVCLEIMAQAHLDVILLAGRYTLLEQTALDELLPACVAANTSVVIGGPYNSGILATGTRGAAAPLYNYAPASAEVIARVAMIEEICAHHGVSLPAAALQFPLAHPQVISVIPGMASPERVQAAATSMAARIPPDFWADLTARELLRPDAQWPEERR